MARIFVIACGVLALDIRGVAEHNGISIKTRFLKGGLHENPSRLRIELQTAIDEVSQDTNSDRIAIGYGICGRGTVGLHARNIPLVIPRVHDCISLFLGGNAPFRRQFKRFPGTYYISAGWYEEKTEPLTQKRPPVYMGDKRVTFDDLVRQYGEDHARDTFDFLNSWRQNYQRAAFIDTGIGNSHKYADYTRQMALRYGWRYERLDGDDALFQQLLTADASTEDILVVPPGQITVFDPQRSTLESGPVVALSPDLKSSGGKIEVIEGPDSHAAHHLQMGLGIDAGGTYTDVVLYNLSSGKVRSKNKALTTRWDFTVGIQEALAGLDQHLLIGTELVALSTTLATNAIVEGDGQKVGLIIMPPDGAFSGQDIPYEPKIVIDGRLEISGRVVRPLNEVQIRRVAADMTAKMGIKAFAVSGYAGAINPEHELRVKHILEDQTGCFVTCGHELSHLLNFRTRAATAVLNARIVPRLVKLLADLDRVLSHLRIAAPVMVVKGDGSLMSRKVARERPVETILSGPAASVAGARFLTQEENAIVIDMGGTTTDTATLSGGNVQIVEKGSRVGDTYTHVRALEIRTSGLGGDSLIALRNGEFTIGPRRVAPMAWLGWTNQADLAMDYLQQHPPPANGSSRGLHFFTLTGRHPEGPLSKTETHLISLLQRRPHSLPELAERTGALHPGLLPLDRLEQDNVVQRCGLTPTDLLHFNGQFNRWNTATACRMCDFMAALSAKDSKAMVDELMTEITRRLALELIKKQLDADMQTGHVEHCDTCRTMIANMLGGGSPNYRIRFQLHRPVIGIGAPIGHFLPRAARLLEAEAILPADADVANAIGAITSHISVRHQLKIRPAAEGKFSIEGLPGTRQFATFEDAEIHAKQQIGDIVRRLAHKAGTSQSSVEIQTEDHTVHTAQGDEIFLERTISAHLNGRPDISQKAV